MRRHKQLPDLYRVRISINKSIHRNEHEPTPQELLERMETFLRLWNALNSLPEIQGRRIDAHIILGKSIKEIAEAEGVHEESIRQSIKRGLERMKKTF